MERQAKDGTIYQQVGEDSWSPVTRTAKDGTVYKKVGEDSWSPLKAAPPSDPQSQESGGLLNSLVKVGKAIDSYTGAPTRAAISAAQKGNNPIPAFTGQFGEDPDKAPTGFDIAKKAGLSDKQPVYMTAEQKMKWDQQNDLVNAGPKPVRTIDQYQDQKSWSPAQIGGAAMTVAADPTLILPVIGESKLVGNVVKGAGETAGKIAEAAKSVMPAKIGFPAVENRAAIEAAAKNLGIENVPKALLTNNPTYQQLESGLSQSGSIPAKSVREQYNNFFKSLQDASDKISSLKSTDSEFASGQKIQSDLAKQVSDAKKPVSQMYEDLSPHLKKIEVNPDVTKKAFAVLKRNPIFQTADGKAMLAEYQSAVSEQPELASLKEFRSTLRDSVGPSASPLDTKRMDAIANTVTSIRDNSINALKEHMPADLHPEVDKLIDDISLADAAHRSNIQDVNSVKGLVANKEFKSPSTFINKLGELKESEIANKAASLDVGSLKNLQGKFPSVFEKVKSAKINDMIQGSTNAVSGFNDASFLKKYQGLDQEMKDLIFDPKMQAHIESLGTLKSAIPPKLGPSGTPGGQMMMDMFSPRRNVLDFGIKSALSSASKASAVADEAPKSQLLGKLLTLVPPAPSLNSTVAAQSALKVADKGPEKWANDGAQKLIAHSPEDKATIEKAKGAMSDPKLKKLLIQASDLKPGSKAMNQVMEKVKAKIATDE